MSENSRQQNAETLSPRAAKVAAKRADYSGEKTTSQQTVEERNNDAREALKNKGNSTVTAVEKDSLVNSDENEETASNTPTPVAADGYSGQEDDDRSEQESAPVLATLGIGNDADERDGKPSGKTKITVENSLTGKGSVTVSSDGNKDEIIIATTGKGSPEELNEIAQKALISEATGEYNDGTEKTLHMLGASLTSSTNNAPLSKHERAEIDQHLKFSPAPGVEINSIMKDKLTRDVIQPASKEQKQEQNLTRYAGGHNKAKPLAEKSLAELEAAYEAEKLKKQASFETIRMIKEEMEKKGRDQDDERRRA